MRKFLERSSYFSRGHPRRTNPLGRFLALSLLAGLLLWRLAVPDASPWLDVLVLAAAGVFLLWARARVKSPPGRWRR